MTLKNNMDQVQQLLDEYEIKIGLPRSTVFIDSEEIQKYLNMKRNEIEKLTGEDCAQISYRLAQFSFYLQRTCNREQARINWADHELNAIVMTKIPQYSSTGGQYTKHEVAFHLALQENEVAQKLDKIKSIASQRVNRLNYLSTSLKHLSDIMLANQKAKSYRGTNV